MKTSARLLLTLCGPVVVIVVLLMLVTPSTVGAPTNLYPVSVDERAAPAAEPPVVFLNDPAWPPYAQTEITVFPDPPLAGQPTEICVWVKNTSAVTQTVAIDVTFANFGIGLPFTPIGSRTITIPPGREAKICLNWIPPEVGHWCLQAVLHQPNFADQISQRNIDIWETLLPGVPALTEFQVMNPLTEALPIHLELKRNPVRADWGMSLLPTDFDLSPGQSLLATLVVTPPLGVKLGTRDVIADVEATALTGQGPQLIGGFRKLDWPPVILHRARDPIYAESEITIDPYPPLAGEPTHICVNLINQSDLPRVVDVLFQRSQQLGIGLPFNPIDQQRVTIPPHSTLKVCTVWIPPQPGHFCVQIILHDPQGLYVDQISQRNLDVSEVLLPGVETPLIFPVQNPFSYPTVITMSAMRIDSFFDVFFDVPTFPLGPGEVHPVTAFITRKPGTMPEPGTIIADLEATYLNDQKQIMLLGGIRKVFNPPIPIHQPGDPPYAEREITIDPYPPRAGEPTQICVELRNPTNVTQTINVEFAIANFGIGLPFQPIQVLPVTLPPYSIVKKCVTWVPPFTGHFCAQVTLIDPLQQFPPVKSQRNMDVGEVFVAGQWTSPFVFPVSNPTDRSMDIEMAMIPHLPDWQISLTPTLLLNMQPHDVRPVTLTVRPPIGVPFPEDDTPIVDVEAHAQGELIGGFRKIYRPPIPIHLPGDPVYAESEIHINPYPPRERQPTEICTDVRNPTDVTQTFTITFAIANFGIGLPFHDIVRPIAVTLPPHSTKTVCVSWVPPFGGHFCAQVTIEQPGHDPVWSQRNMDVAEIFIPGQPSTLAFPVGNPMTQPMTVTLGLVPHLDGWSFELSQDVLTDLAPNATRLVTLTATPPLNEPFPSPASPVVDVEGYIGRDLIGGFRKLFYPPIPVHPPQDPIYAESEIFIDPYPVWLGGPTTIGALVFNPTDDAQQITVTFSVAHFGIGLPFTQTGILTPTMIVNIPPHGQTRVQTQWIAQIQGHICVQIKIQSAGHDPIYSQRNIDVGEPLNPDQPHVRIVEVRNLKAEVVTITMGLINHRPNWQVSITPTLLTNVAPGEIRPVTLTVKPSSWEGLADEQPIADVEAYINGELIGGIRKIARPPVPLHKPQDPPYAESEIGVHPYPLQANKPTTITADIMNTSDVTQTIRVEFAMANFGFGIPFTNTHLAPTYRVITLGPGISQTVGTVWTPPDAGHWCIQIRLVDPSGQYPDQFSQRNVDVERRGFVPCQPFTKDFWLQNSTALTVTVDLGANAINLPTGWTWSTNITETVLNPYQGITVTLTITPPCGLSKQSWLTPQGALSTGGASGPATIDAEGYVDGELLGGIEVQLEAAPPEWKLYLPIIMKQH
jgi:hypothetical protein